MKITLVALAFGAFATPAVAQDKVKDRFLADVHRPSAALEPLIKVSGDSLDTSVTISSQNVTVLVSKGWLASQTNETTWLRAFVDKSTKKVVSQIYYSARYSGNGWQFYSRGTYENNGGPVAVEATRLGSDVNCSRYGCIHYEDVALPIPFEVLEAAAKRFNPAAPEAALRFRLYGQSGGQITDGIPGNEIVAFVNVVNRQRATTSTKP